MSRKNILCGGTVFLLLMWVGFSVSEKQKNQAQFCIGCHAKNLHQKKYKTFRLLPPKNLAGIHNKKSCIACHHGTTFKETIALHCKEIWNLFRYFTGNFEEPKKITWPWVDGACMECHRKLEAEGLFHRAMAHGGKKFPVRCTQCHQSHPEGRNREKYFLSRKVLQKRSNSCHKNYSKVEKYLSTF